MRLLRWLAGHLTGILLMLVPLALVVAMAAPAPMSVAEPLASSATASVSALANVAHADVVSVALAAVLVAVVFLTFATLADRRLEGRHRIARARYLLSHAMPRRYVTTYGVELAGESYAELATWRQWGRRISDHRTYRLASLSTA